jgi:signal transduction histidine kinase
MRQLRRPSAVEALTALLLVAVPVLAVLQYRWLGRVSDAERDRMRASLEAATSQFRLAFDGEVAAAYVALAMDAETYSRGDWPRYAERVERWRRAAPHPALLADLYLVERTIDAAPSVARFDRQTFVPAEAPFDVEALVWPAAADALGHRPPGVRSFGFEYSPTVASVPALVIPVAPNSASMLGEAKPSRFAFVVAVLDRATIDRAIVPELAARFFAPGKDAEYDVTVGGTSDAPADAAAVVFGIDPEEIPRLAPGAPGAADSPSFRRLVGVTASGEKVEEFLLAKPDRGWRLAVTHRDGSLEAAVAAARARNLALGFGTLLLLAASAAALVVASRRAERLARQQVEFVAGVSHELRTPLAVICSAAENLAHGIVASESQVRRYGALIEGEGRRLADLVEQVLEYAGASSNRARYAMQSLDVAPIVDEACEACRRAAGEAGVAVEVDVAGLLPAVAGDAGALRRAVENLVGNAIKYSEGGTVVRVSARPDGDAVEIAVADEGRGIRPEDLPHIFEPFYRGRDAVEAQVRGSGLGLSLARRVVEAHGGTVSVESRMGGGSRFAIRLPAAGPEREEHV